jgi:hypothetical protein
MASGQNRASLSHGGHISIEAVEPGSIGSVMLPWVAVLRNLNGRDLRQSARCGGKGQHRSADSKHAVLQHPHFATSLLGGFPALESGMMRP